MTMAFDPTEEHVTTRADPATGDHQLLAVAATPNIKNARTAWKVLMPIVDFRRLKGLRHDLVGWMFGRPSVARGEL